MIDRGTNGSVLCTLRHLLPCLGASLMHRLAIDQISLLCCCTFSKCMCAVCFNQAHAERLAKYNEKYQPGKPLACKP